MSPAGAAVEPASLTRHGAKVGSVFSLLGRNENDLTAALGFAMARCRPFAAAVLDRVWPTHTAGEAAHFALEVRAEVGHTDLVLTVAVGAVDGVAVDADGVDVAKALSA